VFAMAQYQPNTLETHSRFHLAFQEGTKFTAKMQRFQWSWKGLHAYWKGRDEKVAEHVPGLMLGNSNAVVPDMCQKQ
jgi:hypothetical protein